MSDVDIIEAMQKTGSQKRYRPETTASNGTHQQIRVARASANRTAEQPLVVGQTASQRSTAEYREPRTNAPQLAQQQQEPRRTTQAYQQLPNTDRDVQIAPSLRRSGMVAPHTRQLPPLRQKSPGQMHWLVPAGIGMVGMLTVWLLAVQLLVGCTNIFADPAHFTQTAHLDTVTVKIDAHHESQVRAFLDAQGHVDMLILPIGDPTKAHVVVGPPLSPVPDPQKATITVSAQGTIVTVVVAGPLEANYLATTRKTSPWSIDIRPATQGGH